VNPLLEELLKTFNPWCATAEQEQVPVATTTWAGIQWQSAKSNAMTQENCAQGNSNTECNNTLRKSKNPSHLQQSRSNPQLLINSKNKIHCAAGTSPNSIPLACNEDHPNTDESSNVDRASKVATDLSMCNVSQADVYLEAL